MIIKTNETIDFVRILAAFGVIWIHVQGTVPEIKYLDYTAGMLCVPFFFAVSLTFFISNFKPTESFKDIVCKSWKRIVIPYITWTIIYIGLLLVKSIITHSSSNIIIWKAFLYGESAMHLYYLPMLLVLQAIALGIIYLSRSFIINKKDIGAIILICITIYLFIGKQYNCFGVIRPAHIIVYGIFAFWAALRIRCVENNRYYLFSGIFLLVLASVSSFYEDSFLVFRYIKLLPLGGVALALICMGFPHITLPKWFFAIASLSYGIYLSHVIFLEAFEFIFEKINIDEFVIDIPIKFMIVLGIFICAAIFTHIARKITITRKLLLGEK